MRPFLAIIASLILSACASNDVTPYDNDPLETDFESEALSQRAANIRVDENARRQEEFIFSNDDVLRYICTAAPCDVFREADGYSIYRNADGSFAGFAEPIDVNSVQICGSGDAFKYFDQHDLWTPLRIKRDRGYRGKKDWSQLDPIFCNNQFTEPVVYRDLGLMLINFVSEKAASYGVHVRKIDSNALRKAVVRHNLDLILQQIHRHSKRSTGATFQVLSYRSDHFLEDLTEQTDLTHFANKGQSGVVFINDNDNNPVVIPLVFKSKSSIDQLPSLLNAFSESLAEVAARNQEDAQFIARFMPPKIKKPNVPTIPSMKKGEFEKQAEFESRAAQVVAERESNIHQLIQSYNFAVFRRNEFVKAVTKAYHDYLKRRSTQVLEEKRLFNAHYDLVIKAIHQSLYADLVATRMDYDSEAEKLYLTIESARNNLSEKAVLSATPAQAKKIKLQKDYMLRLDPEITRNSLTLNHVVVIHDGEFINAPFTDAQFKPMDLVMEVFPSTELSLSETQASYSAYLQTDGDLRDDIPKTAVYTRLQKHYNLRRPEWYLSPIKDGVAAQGRSQKEAITNALALLSERKSVLVQTASSVQTQHDEIDQVLSTYKQSYENTIQTSSSTVLTENDYTLSRQVEIDGVHFVELKLL